jgi:hypothetical protein
VLRARVITGMKHKKVLFILKRRSSYGVSYGLVNSCKFVSAALAMLGVDSKIVQVVDNNDIDREVTAYQPTHVIIEALWVVPEKFPVLMQLHPKVKWTVRLHSQVPFLGTEGVAFQWLAGYRELAHKNRMFSIASNSFQLVQELALIGYDLDYLPNIYIVTDVTKVKFNSDKIVHVGCFGAIRPFKNHLEQAVGAMIFANRQNKILHFHINASRFEHVGESFLKNLRYLFANSQHKLVEHDWSNHADFIKLVRQMDLGLQVSFTETFNIVAADFVVNHIPIVGSPEIEWLSGFYQADPTNALDIADKLEFAYRMRVINAQYLNEVNLARFNKQAVNAWKIWL